MGIGERQRDTPVERQDGNDQEVPQGEKKQPPKTSPTFNGGRLVLFKQ
jgi:hypothetical protein